MMTPNTCKHLSADALFGMLHAGFADIADHCPGDPDIALTDTFMSALAMFSLGRWRPALTKLKEKSICAIKIFPRINVP